MLMLQLFLSLLHLRLDISQAKANLLNAFKVNSQNGALTVGNVSLDYERVEFYSVNVETIDSGHPPKSFTGTLLINVTDVNEAATNITLSNDKVMNTYDQV